MFLCLAWLIYALTQLKYGDDSCWDPFTMLYFNYYFLILIVLGPAMTIGVLLALGIVCLPCIIGHVCKTMRDERERTEMG